jgi:hypothetical protein
MYPVSLIADHAAHVERAATIQGKLLRRLGFPIERLAGPGNSASVVVEKVDDQVLALFTVSRWEGMKPSPSGEAFRYTIVDGKLSNFCPYAF